MKSMSILPHPGILQAFARYLLTENSGFRYTVYNIELLFCEGGSWESPWRRHNQPPAMGHDEELTMKAIPRPAPLSVKEIAFFLQWSDHK
jgi:hypothetical protein